MHRCEVTVSRGKLDEDGIPEEVLPCGDHAARKLGKVWVCNQHWQQFAEFADYDITSGLYDSGDLTSD